MYQNLNDAVEAHLLDELSKIKLLSTSERALAYQNLTKLYEVKIKDDDITAKANEQAIRRGMDDNARVFDEKLETKKRRDEIIKNVTNAAVTVGTTVLQLYVYSEIVNKTIQFETDGVGTTSAFRSLLQKLNPFK